MKVLMVNANREVTYTPVAPLGLAYLCTALQSSGHEISFLDLSLIDNWFAELERSITSFQPEVIGVSIRNIDNSSYSQYINYLPLTREIINRIKCLSNASVILGGSGFSLQPSILLEYFDCCYGVVGEGELAFPLLLKWIENKGSITQLDSIPNLIYRNPADNNNKPFLVTKKSRLTSEQFIQPDRSFLSKSFLHSGDLGNIETRRGCVFGCIYCNIATNSSRTIECRGIHEVIKDLEKMESEGYTKVFIVDNIFNYPYSFTYELCEKMIEKQLDIQWQCQIHPRFWSHDLGAKMYEAGCRSIDVAATTACDPLLVSLRKGFTLDMLDKTIQSALACGISANVFFNLGIPGDTKESLAHTIEYMHSIESQGAQVACDIGLRILPDTQLELRHRAINMDIEQLDKPHFYVEPGVQPHIFELYDQLPEHWTHKASAAIYEALLRKVTDHQQRQAYIKKMIATKTN